MQFFAPPTLRRSLASLGMTPGFTANRAGLFAGLLYLCLVPQVLRWPIDGDEPYYLLVSESLIADRDLDLRNQYAAISRSETRRPDLRPQVGDPVGREGQQYSRTEPFLSLLMIPGFLLFGLPGALATIAIFGGLLVRSTLLLLSEQRISNRAIRVCFVFLALGPPILFYATRIWPEVPAAFCLVEALRGLRNERVGRLTAALAGLALLKLRFALIAVALVVLFFLKLRPKRATVVAVLMLLALPFVLIFLTTGQWLNVHELWELIPQSWWKYPRGLFGLLLDAQAGLLFQAPFYLLGLAALIRWRELPATVKWAIGSVALYLILLFPRDEWHGGWSPPLRYLVVLIPVLAVAAATLVDRLPAAILALLGIITAAFTIHGLAFPWRLFHIASGESVLGEFLSARYGTDFSRMLPSFVRLNRAAVVASIVLILVAGLSLLVRRIPTSIGIGVLALLLAAGFTLGRLPGDVVNLGFDEVARVEFVKP